MAREESRNQLAPNVYVAGPLLDGEPTVYAGKAPGFPEIGRTLTTPEQAIDEVDRLAAAGVDHLKAYEMLSPDVFKAILSRATAERDILILAELLSGLYNNANQSYFDIRLKVDEDKRHAFVSREISRLENSDFEGFSFLVFRRL